MGEWRSMSELEQRAAALCGKLRYPTASWAKRLGHALARQAETVRPLITEAQCRSMWVTLYRFRRQVQDRSLTAKAIEVYAEADHRPWLPAYRWPPAQKIVEAVPPTPNTLNNPQLELFL